MKIATTIGEMYAFTSSPAEAIRQYEGTGFKYLDYSFYTVLAPNHPFMSDAWRDGIREAKETADKLGFQFVQAHAPCCEVIGGDTERELEATIRSIEACGTLGIKNMVMHSACVPEYKHPEDASAYFKANEPFFRALIPAMEKHGVNILFENTTIKHCGDRNYFPIYGKDLNSFVEHMNHPLFGAAWDVGHAHMDDIDHETEILEMGKNLRAIHVHDNDGRRDMHTAPFLGTLNYDSLMRGLIHSGFDGYFTLEADGFFKYVRSATRMKEPNGRLAHPTLEVKKQALSLLYTIAKAILSEYGVFEE
jgi:sugar phosphate isomerase/epimerase